MWWVLRVVIKRKIFICYCYSCHFPGFRLSILGHLTWQAKAICIIFSFTHGEMKNMVYISDYPNGPNQKLLQFTHRRNNRHVSKTPRELHNSFELVECIVLKAAPSNPRYNNFHHLQRPKGKICCNRLLSWVASTVSQRTNGISSSPSRVLICLCTFYIQNTSTHVNNRF